nr:MAG TPA: hypothetical protein [Caudoviricetes sp.]
MLVVDEMNKVPDSLTPPSKFFSFTPLVKGILVSRPRTRFLFP